MDPITSLVATVFCAFMSSLLWKEVMANDQPAHFRLIFALLWLGFIICLCLSVATFIITLFT